MGSTRHLRLLGEISTETIEWPAPFADGLPVLMARRGTPTVVLASGDPFWFGAGSVITRDVPAGDLALGRATQVNKPGLARRLMKKLRG